MKRRGILSTILVIQLVLLLILTVSQIQSEKEHFSTQQQFERIAAYKISSSFENIRTNIEFLREINATEESINIYLEYVNNTYGGIYFTNIHLNQTHLILMDEAFEMRKEGLI